MGVGSSALFGCSAGTRDRGTIDLKKRDRTRTLVALGGCRSDPYRQVRLVPKRRVRGFVPQDQPIARNFRFKLCGVQWSACCLDCRRFTVHPQAFFRLSLGTRDITLYRSHITNFTFHQNVRRSVQKKEAICMQRYVGTRV